MTRSDPEQHLRLADNAFRNRNVFAVEVQLALHERARMQLADDLNQPDTSLAKNAELDRLRQHLTLLRERIALGLDGTADA